MRVLQCVAGIRVVIAAGIIAVRVSFVDGVAAVVPTQSVVVVRDLVRVTGSDRTGLTLVVALTCAKRAPTSTASSTSCETGFEQPARIIVPRMVVTEIRSKRTSAPIKDVRLTKRAS